MDQSNSSTAQDYESAVNSYSSGSAFDSDSDSDKSVFGEIGAQVGDFISDVVGNVKDSVKEAIGMVTQPGSALKQAAKSAASEVAQPFTSIVDAWLPGEPVQDAWNKFIGNAVDSTANKVDSTIDDASRALGIEFDNERSSKSPDGEGFGTKFNEYVQDVKRELSGDKKTQSVSPSSRSQSSASSGKKKTKSKRKGRLRKGKSFIKGKTITRYN
jgi:hypothetical protein